MPTLGVWGIGINLFLVFEKWNVAEVCIGIDGYCRHHHRRPVWDVRGTNERPVSRSCDHSQPIRGQCAPMWDVRGVWELGNSGGMFEMLQPCGRVKSIVWDIETFELSYNNYMKPDSTFCYVVKKTTLLCSAKTNKHNNTRQAGQLLSVLAQVILWLDKMLNSAFSLEGLNSYTCSMVTPMLHWTRLCFSL